MQGLEFLGDAIYGRSVKSVIRESTNLDLAVAYWRNEILGDLEILAKLDEIGSSRLRVICDLWHPACHWQPIEELIHSGVCVKRMDGLHAKVWIGQAQVIIGSANSSRPALYLPGPTEFNLEAGVKITDNTFVDSMRAWFNRNWESNQAKIVSVEDLERKKRYHPCSQRVPRVPPPDDVRETDRNRPFEYFVGVRAGRNYRRNLEELGFGPEGRTGNLGFQWAPADSLNDFSMGLIEATEQLLREARHIGTKEKRTRVPPGFREQVQGGHRVLYERIADFVERDEGDRLWLTAGTRRHSYSLRLAHTRSGMESIAVMTFRDGRIDTAQNR